MSRDFEFMAGALALAREGVALASPNPMVGCLVVYDGEIAGFGCHTWDGVKHAEVLALEQAGDRARGATVYVTLEPCAHIGRTGPCCDALIAAGVARVVYASHDPNPEASGAGVPGAGASGEGVPGEGLRRLRAAGIQVEHDTAFEAEAVKLNEPFFHYLRARKPLVTLKCAMTLDGKIAAPEDNTGWITSERARHHVQGLRHAADAIVTGIGTVLADDPLLTDRSGRLRARPLLRVVLDSTLRLPLDSKMAQSAAGDLVVVSTSAASAERRHALEKKGIEVKSFDGPRGRVDILDVVSMLGERRCLSALIEAGSKLNWAVLEAGAADKVFLYYAPKILGGTASLPMAGGAGRQRRTDAIQLERTVLHPIPPDEFAVEAFVRKES